MSTEASHPRATAATLTVGELADRLRGVLGQAFPDRVWVTGDIGNIHRMAGGPVFFDLIEPAPQPGGIPAARVNVVLFNEVRGRVNAMLKRHGNAVRMTDGVEVRIEATVDYYPPAGRIQLQMTAIDPAHTLGRLVVEREVLMKTLAGEGLLRANAARGMAPVPLRVGLVTSLGSAAHADFMSRLERSRFAFEVTEVHTPVQGREAPRAIAAAISAAASVGDLVVMVRGGGSRTDLAAFDHETVARAIAACGRPVFTGIGHETDRSVADEVAHTAHPTPTAAAVDLVGRVTAFLAGLDDAARVAAHRSRHHLQAAGHRIDTRAATLAVAGNSTITDAQRRIDTAVKALDAAQRDTLSRAGLRLDSMAARVSAFDPIRTLRRGWSITRTATGRVVRSTADVTTGEVITTQVGDGTLTSTIRNPVEPE